jgi:hypothetical protein
MNEKGDAEENLEPPPVNGDAVGSRYEALFHAFCYQDNKKNSHFQ